MEAQASATEEKEARTAAEVKLETASLVEEEVSILREALQQMESDSAVAQRGMYQMHDQVYEVHTVLTDERDAAHQRAQAAEREVNALRERINEMQAALSLIHI